MSDSEAVKTLYQRLLRAWDDKDAVGCWEQFAEDGSIVGFDGSCVETRASIIDHLQSIFADHEPATYVSNVREVRPVGEDAMLLRSVVGMVPPGGSDIEPDKNVVQALTAVRTERGWQIAHFQNTPAALDAQPDAADALTAELRAVLREP